MNAAAANEGGLARRYRLMWALTGLAALILLLSTAALALRESSAPAGPAQAVLTSSGTPIYLRADPGASARILAVLAPGTPVEVQPSAADPDSAWRRITVDGRTGWVPASNVALR